MAEKSQNFWTEGIEPQKKLCFAFWPPCWALLRCWWTRIGNIQRTSPSYRMLLYTSIAINGLLFHDKPTSAVVTVDGKTHPYHHVWLAPTMNGRYYGGGMIPTPAQRRLNPDGTISTMAMYGKGKLKTLTVFPSIFKGAHIRHSEMVEVLTGHPRGI